MLTAIAFIGLAGAGSAIRFLAADRWPGGHRGTLLVNVAGSLLLGPVSYTHLTLPTKA